MDRYRPLRRSSQTDDGRHVWCRPLFLPDGKSPVTFGELVPDVAIEVLSPGESPQRIAQKIGEFLDVGVALVWLVDPQSQIVTVYRSRSETRQLTTQDTIDGEPVLPGFACLVSRFF